MQLSLHADYALRVLMYLGAHPERTVSTVEISNAYSISRNHLVRVVQTLSEHGYIDLRAGRSGGMRLARDPRRIRLGDVVRDAEPNMRLVECFDLTTNKCPIVPVCSLKLILAKALNSFLDTLNKHTLADLVDNGKGERLASAFAALVSLQSTLVTQPG